MTVLQELISKLESLKKELTIKTQRKPTYFSRGRMSVKQNNK